MGRPVKRSPASLTGKQRRYLRSLAHHLNPVIQIGHAGVTQGLLDELDRALETHELIKVRVGGESPVEPDEAAKIIEPAAACHVAQVIGRVLVLYRQHPEEPTIELPRAGVRPAILRSK